MVIKVKYFAGGKVMTTVTRSQNQSDIVILWVSFEYIYCHIQFIIQVSKLNTNWDEPLICLGSVYIIFSF
jgi:hypothetical protein